MVQLVCALLRIVRMRVGGVRGRRLAPLALAGAVVANLVAVGMPVPVAASGATYGTPSEFYLPCCVGGPPLYPRATALADLNRDSIPDFIVANPTTATVDIHLGHGDGTFASAVTYYVGYLPVALAVGDVNNDGFADIVVAQGGSWGYWQYSVLLGRGDGTFRVGGTYTGAAYALDVTLGYLNGDRNLDLVITGGSQMEVLFGNGDGTFQTPVSYSIHGAGASSTIYDLNGDGRADIVVAEGGPPGADWATIGVFLNNGDGTFATRVGYTIGNTYATSVNVAVGDLNRDGIPDLAVSDGNCGFDPGHIEVFIGNGAGAFASGFSLDDGCTSDVAITDATGSGNLDIVGVSYGPSGSRLGVYPGNGDGTFGTRVDYPPPDPNTKYLTFAVGDMNRDGKPDVIMTSGGNPNTGVNPISAVYLNLTSGPFLPVGGNVKHAETLGGTPPCLSCMAQLFTQPAHADPVNTSDGNFTEQYGDIMVPGRGFPLAFTRTYNSLSAATGGPLGYGWTDSYNAGLSQDPTTGAVTVTQENGSQVTFAKVGSTSPPSYGPTAPRTIASLVQNADVSWVFTRKRNEILRFSASGLLQSMADRNGYATSLSYNAGGQLTTITDPAGRTLSLTYAGGVLSGVTDQLGRTVQYGYNDGAGNLTDVTDVNGGTTHYTYDASHELLTIRDPRMNVVTTNHYDSSGRVDYQLDGLQRKTSFTYAPDGSSTITTDPAGNQIEETFAGGVRTSLIRGYGTSQAATWTFVYDPFTLGDVSITDPDGHTTYRSFDGSGNVLTASDPLGRTTTMAYNSFNEPTATTDPNGVTTAMTYDANGNLLSRSTPLLGSSPPQSQTASYAYGDSTHPGDVTAMTDANSKTWHYTWDPDGNLASTTDPLGDEATTAYNVIGWKTSSVSPRGNVSGCGCASRYTTTYSYTDPQTGTLDGFGDVRVLTDPLGHQTVNTYDGDRNLVTVKDADGNLTQSTYDAANQLTAVTRGVNTPAQTTSQTAYWPNGLVETQSDGNLNATSYQYDALDRLTSVTTPATAACPQGCTTSYTYDAAGNRLTMVDAQNQTTSYGYDAANELTSIRYSDGTTPNVTAIGYDADGQRIAMTDGTGSSAWAWDSLHRMTSSTDGAGKTVGYGYNLRGDLTSLAYPDGHTVTRVYDDAGRLTGVSDWLGNTTTYTPDPDSNLTAQTYPNGTAATLQYDQAGRLGSISDAPTGAPGSPFASFGYGRDANGQLQSSTTTGTPPPPAESYAYTPLNQLAQDNSAAFGYDLAGNPTRLDTAFQTFDAADEIRQAGGVSLVGAVSAGSATATSSTLTVPLPAGVQPGDLIAVGSTQPTGVAVTLSGTGWTFFADPSSGAGTSHTSVFRKFAAAGDSSVTLNYGQAGARSVVIVVYRGVDQITPLDGTSTSAGATGTTVTAPATTTVLAGDRLVVLQAAAQNAQAAGWTAPPGMTEETQLANQPLVSAGAADQILTGTGSTGGRTSTVSAAGGADLVTVMFPLRPAQTTFGFDARGNRTTVTPQGGSATTLTYDQANRLTAYGSSATYAYNGDGLRTSKTVGGVAEGFVYDQAEGLPLPIVDGSTEYVYGAGGAPLEQITSLPAAISLVSTSHNSDGPTGGGGQVALAGSIQAGDQILVSATFPAGTGNSASPPSGYVQVGSPVTSGTGPNADVTVVFRKTAAGNEGGTTLTIPFNGQFARAMVTAVYRGVDQANPIDFAQSNTATLTNTVQTATATARYSNERVVVFQGATYVGPGPDGWHATSPLNEDDNTPNAQTVASGVADTQVSAAGAVGPYTSTFDTTGELSTIMVGLHQPPSLVFFHQDQLGSTRVLTDPVGQAEATLTYDSYGRLTGTTGTVSTPLLYAGQYHDAESGLYYLRARYYDPTTAQFLTRDPLVATTRSPYGYVAGDPLNRVDPTGRVGETPPGWHEMSPYEKLLWRSAEIGYRIDNLERYGDLDPGHVEQVESLLTNMQGLADNLNRSGGCPSHIYDEIDRLQGRLDSLQELIGEKPPRARSVTEAPEDEGPSPTPSPPSNDGGPCVGTGQPFACGYVAPAPGGAPLPEPVPVPEPILLPA